MYDSGTSLLDVLQLRNRWLLRLQYTFRGVLHTSDVAHQVETVPKTLYQIKAYRTGYQTIPTILKMNFQIFHDF